MKHLFRLARWTLFGWLLWRLFGPEVEPRYDAVQRRPLKVPGRTVFAGDLEVFVREAGPPDGPSLVLIHGWNLDGEMTFHRIVPALAERFRVIMPDLRDHGKTDWPRGRFEIEDLADDVAATLDALGVEGATVFGYSMGGMVAQCLADRHPRHVARLVLAATAARPIPQRRALTRVAFWLGRAIARVSRQEAATITSDVLIRSGAIEPAHLRWMYAALMRRDATLYYEVGGAIWRFDATGWVGSLAMPAMVVIPTRDQVVPPEAQRELAALLPDPKVVEISGGRHEAVLNRCDEFVRLLTEFAAG
jgi:3-oxoadipate enol-lactonase